MKCPLRPGSIGDKVFCSYQQKIDLTHQAQKKASAKARKYLLKAKRRKQYFIERMNTTNKGEYLKHQLDTAITANRSMLDVVNPTPPTTSMQTSLEEILGTAQHLRDALQAPHSHSMSQIRAQTQRRKAAKKHCRAKRAAKTRYTGTQRQIRNQHSYGSLV